MHASGTTVLCEAVREMVANLTARGPFARVTLPAVTFIDEIQPPSPARQRPAKKTAKRTRGAASRRAAR